MKNTLINKSHYLLFLPVLALLAGCATTSPMVGSGNVKYGDAKAVEAVTNQFGSTDLQTIAESMTKSLIQSPVLSEAKKRPLITMSEVKNKTSEYIDTKAITDTIRTQLSKSGLVKFAVDISEMQNQTDELNRQNSGLYKKNASKKIGQMEGADYRLDGSIVSIVKKNDSVKDVYYKFNLNLVDIETGVLEWSDEKEIRKTSTR
jgi:uncharacterized protein (TIGR02722 family)